MGMNEPQQPEDVEDDILDIFELDDLDVDHAAAIAPEGPPHAGAAPDIDAAISDIVEDFGVIDEPTLAESAASLEKLSVYLDGKSPAPTDPLTGTRTRLERRLTASGFAWVDQPIPDEHTSAIDDMETNVVSFHAARHPMDNRVLRFRATTGTLLAGDEARQTAVNNFLAGARYPLDMRAPLRTGTAGSNSPDKALALVGLQDIASLRRLNFWSHSPARTWNSLVIFDNFHSAYDPENRLLREVRFCLSGPGTIVMIPAASPVWGLEADLPSPEFELIKLSGRCWHIACWNSPSLSIGDTRTLAQNNGAHATLALIDQVRSQDPRPHSMQWPRSEWPQHLAPIVLRNSALKLLPDQEDWLLSQSIEAILGQLDLSPIVDSLRVRLKDVLAQKWSDQYWQNRKNPGGLLDSAESCAYRSASYQRAALHPTGVLPSGFDPATLTDANLAQEYHAMIDLIINRTLTQAILNSTADCVRLGEIDLDSISRRLSNWPSGRARIDQAAAVIADLVDKVENHQPVSLSPLGPIHPTTTSALLGRVRSLLPGKKIDWSDSAGIIPDSAPVEIGIDWFHSQCSGQTLAKMRERHPGMPIVSLAHPVSEASRLNLAERMTFLALCVLSAQSKAQQSGTSLLPDLGENAAPLSILPPRLEWLEGNEEVTSCSVHDVYREACIVSYGPAVSRTISER